MNNTYRRQESSVPNAGLKIGLTCIAILFIFMAGAAFFPNAFH